MARRALVMMVGLGLQLVSLAGCSSQGDGGVSGSSDLSSAAPAAKNAAPAPVTVTSHTVNVSAPGCTAEGELPTIVAATPDVSNAITKVPKLPSDATIFSTSWLENGFDEEGYTFATATGKELALADVLTPDGIKILQGACADGLVAQGEGEISAEDAAAMCGSANLGFMLKDAGVRPMPELGAAFAAIELDPVPWSKLSGKAQPIAADYAKAHGG